MKRTIQIPTLLFFLAAIQFCFAAMSIAQQPTQKRVTNSKKDQAKASIAGNQFPVMPDFTTGGITFDTAKATLNTRYRQERIIPVPEPSDRPAGEILAQDPAPGTPLKADTVITLHFSNGNPPASSTNLTAELSVIETLIKKKEYWAGDSVQYRIVINNGGPLPATNVQLTATPTNLTNITFDVTECNGLKCTIKKIDPGSSATVNVTATIVANGTFANTVTVVAAEPDRNNTDNTSADNAAEANSAADVYATQQLDTVGPFHAGQSVQYTMVINNAGPSNATNIKVLQKRDNLTINEVSGACNKLPCTIPGLAAGAVATIIVTASIDHDGAFQIAGDVRAAEHDLKPDNNIVPNVGGIATSNPRPPQQPTPSPSPFPWWGWIVIVAGLAGAGGGTLIISRLIPRPVPPGPSVPTPGPPPTPPVPPTPLVTANVDLRTGESEIDGLQFAGPQIRLRTGLEMGPSSFEGPVPIDRRQIINE